jgi:acetolactate synthase I/II/III large subunit
LARRVTSPLRTVYAEIAEFLRSQGVDDFFGLVGEDVVAFVTALSLSGGRFLAARHESAAAAMADGYSWASGKVGVCTVTRGPGLTNALTACRTAVRGDRSLLLITGDVPRGKHQSIFKDMDQGPICRTLGLKYFPVATTADIRRQLGRAWVSARGGRPAVLAVAADVLNGPGETGLGPDQAAVLQQGRALAQPHNEDVIAIVDLLASSERPLLLAGQGACSPSMRETLVEIATRSGALVGTTLLAKGLFRGCPFDVGVVGGFADDRAVDVLAQVDLVVAFGASLSPYTTGQKTLFRDARIVHVDVDPTRIGVHSDVALGVIADAESVAQRVLERLEPRGSSGRFVPSTRDPRAARKSAGGRRRSQRRRWPGSRRGGACVRSRASGRSRTGARRGTFLYCPWALRRHPARPPSYPAYGRSRLDRPRAGSRDGRRRGAT